MFSYAFTYKAVRFISVKILKSENGFIKKIEIVTFEHFEIDNWKF